MSGKIVSKEEAPHGARSLNMTCLDEILGCLMAYGNMQLKESGQQVFIRYFRFLAEER